jgi:uncharacterized membrane protein
MQAYALEWLQLLLRCLHVITGIAWIGASFYFVWLDNHLQKPTSKENLDKGVDGELWAVHGGGFYNPQKYMVAPKSLPNDLHWFYWESYSTWMSGFALFVVVYLLNAKTMLVDTKVADISGGQAVTFALVILLAGWIIYDLVCRWLREHDLLVGMIVAGMVVLVSWLTCQLFAARAAYLITGAMMATAMTANVFFWIIPGQRKVIVDMKEGRTPDPIHGQRGKQRSVHNTYFTLPVLFTMLSNHFHMIYSDKYQWILLVVMMFAGVLIRHYFVLRHKGFNAWWYPAVATALIASIVIYLAPSRSAQANAVTTATIDEVKAIIDRRCVPCHAPNSRLMGMAPKNLSLVTIESIESNANLIYVQSVQQKIMPVGNVTEMTDAERETIRVWFENRQ